MQQTLSAMDKKTISEKSRSACVRLSRQEEFHDAAVVMLYLNMPQELDVACITLRAWGEGKHVVVPKVNPDSRHMDAVEIRSLDTDVAPGAFGIREPISPQAWPLEEIDLVIVPALAFDREGNRLGRGGGYYDRFLGDSRLRAIRCGICFDEQIVEDVPCDDHDVPMDMLVSEREVLRFAWRERDRGRR